MESIKYSIFDFFSYFLPGFIFITLLYLYNLDFEPDNLNLIFKNFEKINNNVLIIITPISYVIGFILSVLGELFYNYLIKRIFKPKLDLGMRKSEAYILVREFSYNNFKYIEVWNAYKKLCINISITSIMFFLILVVNYKSLSFNIFLFCLIINFLLLYNAFKFDRWSIIELKNTIEKFDLNNDRIKKFNKKNDL